MTTAEQKFNEGTRQLLESLVSQSGSPSDTDLLVIVNATQEMCAQIRSENSEILADGVSSLLHLLYLTNSQEPEEWLTNAFESIIKDLDSDKGWPAYVALVNTIHLIVEVAQKFSNQGRSIKMGELKQQLKEKSFDYIKTKLKPRILDLGGWSDFINYQKHVNTRRELESKSTREDVMDLTLSHNTMVILGICFVIIWLLQNSDATQISGHAHPIRFSRIIKPITVCLGNSMKGSGTSNSKIDGIHSPSQPFYTIKTFVKIIASYIITDIPIDHVQLESSIKYGMTQNLDGSHKGPHEGSSPQLLFPLSIPFSF